MPFNRDLIESGCTLKTYNGDLSVLERVIDYTINKPAVSSQPRETNAEQIKSFTTIPARQNEVCIPRQARRIKEIVYGEHLDEMSWSQDQTVTCPVSNKNTDISATATGFCFRHTVEEDAETVASTVLGESTTAVRQHNVRVQQSKMMQPTCTESKRVARSVKDAVHGETEIERPLGQSISSKQKYDVPQHPVKHFKFRMHDGFSTDSVPAAIAGAKQSFDVSHAHWRSAIHGF